MVTIFLILGIICFLIYIWRAIPSCEKKPVDPAVARKNMIQLITLLQVLGVFAAAGLCVYGVVFYIFN
jgi:hypothetical protein